MTEGATPRPVAYSGSLPIADPPRANAMSLPPDAMRSRLRCLVVDDSRTEQRLAAVALRTTGCEVTVVGSAQQALIALDDASYAFVLLDQQLPDLPGTSLAGLVRREFLAPPPIAVWSADGSVEDAAVAAGAVAFLAKPVPPATLGKLAIEHLRAPGDEGHQPLLDDKQLRDSRLVAPTPDEARIFVGNWQAEIASLLEEAVTAARVGALSVAQAAVHKLLGCAALTGAKRLRDFANALHTSPDRLCEHEVVEAALELTRQSAAALLLRTAF